MDDYITNVLVRKKHTLDSNSLPKRDKGRSDIWDLEKIQEVRRDVSKSPCKSNQKTHTGSLEQSIYTY